MMPPVRTEAPAASSRPVTEPACPARLWSKYDTAIIAVLVLLALARGLLFASVQWPWYAPDEQDHVEYAVLTRAHGPLVGREHLSQPLRFAIATSLYEWKAHRSPPPANADLSPLWTGQVGRQPPLYYLLAGWVSSAAPSADLIAQLYTMRALSAVIVALIVAAAYVAGRLLDPSTPLVAVGLAGVSLFQTTIGALSGAVTNDGLAILGVTLVLATGLALVRAPLSARRYAVGFAAMLAALAVALLAKRTAVVAVPPGLLALVLAGWPLARGWLVSRRLLRPAAAVGLIGLAALPLAVVEYRADQASDWSIANAARVAARPALAGEHALLLGANGDRAEAGQHLNRLRTRPLRNHQLTFGAWLRLAQPGPPQPVSLHLTQQVNRQPVSKSVTVTVGEEWRFASVSNGIAPNATAIVLAVTREAAAAGGVLLDGAVLVQGEPGGSPDPAMTGESVRWGGELVRNLLVNPAYESAPLRPRAWLEQAALALIGRDLDSLVTGAARLSEMPDEPEEWRVQIVEPFFETLWGRLGRAAELTMPAWWYTVHAGLLAAAVVGAVCAGARAVRRRQVRTVHVKIGALLSLTLIGAAVVTLVPFSLGLYTGLPSGRYFLVALVPVAGLYVSGLVRVWPRPVQGVATLLLLAVMAMLDAYVLFYALPLHFSIGLPNIQ